MNTVAAEQDYAELLQRVPQQLRNLEDWPEVDLSTIKEEYRARYRLMCKAARLFLKLQPVKEVVAIARMPAYRFFAHFEEALKPWPGGGFTGTRAFVKYLVQKPRTRVAPRTSTNPMGGYSGFFDMLLREKPGIEVDLKSFLNGRERPNKVGPKVLRDKFIAICIEHGVGPDHYPRCVHDQGHKPLMEWFSKVYLAEHCAKHVRLNSGVAAAVAAGYERGDGQSRTPSISYLIWVIDEFDCNVNSKIEIPSERWGQEIVEVRRFPVLRCRSIGDYAMNIAWHMCVTRQASGPDVIQLFRNAVMGQPEPTMLDPNMQVEEGAGFPQDVFHELAYVLPILVYLDNALSHLFNDLQELLTRLYGGRVLLGIPGKPKGRPEIESAIAHTMQGLLKQLPGALGSGPLDPTRKQAERPVEQYLHVNHVEQAIHVRLANENVSDTASAGYLDGFTRMKRLLARTKLNLNTLPENKHAGFNFSAPRRRSVKCDLGEGRLAHINWGGRRYTNEWLKINPGLKGKGFWVLVDYNDLRTVVLSDDNLIPVSVLRCEGAWGKVPHDQRIWRIYCRRKHDARFKSQPRDVPLYCVLKVLAEGASSDPSMAQDYAYCMRYFKTHLTAAELAAVAIDEIEGSSNDEEFIAPPMLETGVGSARKFEGTKVHELSAPMPSASRFAVPRRVS
jgi:putative transposase